MLQIPVYAHRFLRNTNKDLFRNKIIKPLLNKKFSIYKERNVMSEAEKSDHAKESGNNTIFDKIIKKEIPSTIVYEDDKCIAFRDVSPQAPIHVILVPKKRDGLTRLAYAEERHKDILGHLFYTASLVAKQENLDKGYRLVVNDGPEGCQSVYHLHIHIIGGKKLGWPPC